MATAGKATRTGVTTTNTNPTSSDLGGTVTSSAFNRTWNELDTTYQGANYSSVAQGLKTGDIPFSADFDAADPAISRLETAHEAGTTIYVHVLFDGTNGKRAPCVVPGLNIESSVDGKVTVSATIRIVGAPAASTLS